METAQHDRSADAGLFGEKQFRSLFESALDAIFLTDADGAITAANPAALAMFVAEGLNLIGAHIGGLFELEDSVRVAVNEARQRTGVIRAEFVCIRKNGTRFPAEVQSVLFDKSSNQTFVIIRDISERKVAESALLESQRQTTFLAELLQAASQPFVVGYPNGRLGLMNSAFEALTGYTADELRSIGWMAITPPRWHEMEKQKLIEQRRNGLPMRYEKEYLRKDGTIVPIELLVHVVNDADGKPDYYYTFLTDITERKQAEAALKKSDARLTTAIANLREGVIIATEAGDVIYWNPAAMNMHGFLRLEDGIGPLKEAPKAFDLIDPDTGIVLPLEQWPMPRVMRGESVQNVELRLRRPDQGWERYVSYSGAMVETSSDEKLVFLSVYDLTERKQAEEALAAAKISAEQAKATAESASQAKDHFLAVLSHELRTPLNPALMAATILERDPQLPPDLREDVELIRRNIELEARLIDDMLDLTRISRGKLTLSRRIADGVEILKHAIETCNADVVEKHLSLSVQLPPTPVHVNADPARLQQIFWNVLKNAVKFTPDHGRISVTATVSDSGGFRVEVTDTGKGIDQEALPLIFEAFEQGHAAVNKRYGGLGLGLAICKGLIRMHEGTIWARSEGTGCGSTFIVELPSISQDRKLPTAALGENKVWTASTAPPRFHILLVEDHESSANVTARLLRSNGYEVTVADCVKVALEKFTEDRGDSIDLVISDLGLPDGSGESLLRHLLALRPIKAIALSGYGMDSDVQKSAAAGFVAHLTKPVNAAQLEETVARTLESVSKL